MSRFSGLAAGILFLLALVLGVFAWQERQNATVLVEWSTASELNTAGFNIYRSENPEGPFSRINTDLIPASLDPLTGGQYKYQDEPVAPGKLYYYQLEELETGGGSTRFGPISVRASGGNGIVLLAVTAVGLLVSLGAVWVVLQRRSHHSVAAPPATDTDL